jgi:alkanesulfonate monooxygenase SsuD/methylene tetrahydromethanopterin reductase-like flavin-dependent oxidoreductase (luciferase family)
MIGGGGEKKTLRLVAQYADESNLICPPNEVPRKLDALAGHCERLGRDRSEIVVSVQANACVAPTHEQALAEADGFLTSRGIDVASMSAEDAQQFRAMVTIGDPDEIGEIFAARLVDGVDGFTLNAAANGHIEGRVALLGEVLAKVIGIAPG